MKINNKKVSHAGAAVRTTVINLQMCFKYTQIKQILVLHFNCFSFQQNTEATDKSMKQRGANI